MRFIYVMNEEGANVMEAHGYRLLKYDDRQGIWCFENKQPDNMAFSLDVPCVFSNTLTF